MGGQGFTRTGDPGVSTGRSVCFEWYNEQNSRQEPRQGFPRGAAVGAGPQLNRAKEARNPKMLKIEPDANLILIGMPGVGKSTVGVLLAKAVSRDFLDTDVYVQAKEGRSLQEIIDEEGTDSFCRLEERHILALDCRSSVIATGGSVVYHAAAMEHLASSGVIIHLSLDLPALERRLTNLDSRGVVMAPGQSLTELFAEREPLYQKYAQYTISCAKRTHEGIVREIIRRLGISCPISTGARPGKGSGRGHKSP